MFHSPQIAANVKIVNVMKILSHSFHWKVALVGGKTLRKSLFWFSHTFSKISIWNSDTTTWIWARPRHCQKSGEPDLRKFCLDLLQITRKSTFKDPGSEFICQLIFSHATFLIFLIRYSVSQNREFWRLRRFAAIETSFNASMRFQSISEHLNHWSNLKQIVTIWTRTKGYVQC